MLDLHLIAKQSLNYGFIKLLKKYAVILAIMLVLRVAAFMLVPLATATLNLTDIDTFYYQLAKNSVFYVFNLITAVLVYSDMTRINLISWSIILLTVLSNELGASMFLLFVLYYTVQSHRPEEGK
jgi:hypothetical protein